jgi:hypothetical protein
MRAPLVIRLTALAELLGVGPDTLRRACREAGIPIVKVRRVILEEPNHRGGPLYLPVEAAATVAERVLGKLCDRNLRRRLMAMAKKQDGAFGPNKEVELA